MTPQAPTPVGTPSGVVVTALLGLGAAIIAIVGALCGYLLRNPAR